MTPYHGHPDPQDEVYVGLIRSGGAAGEAAMKALYVQYRHAVHSSIVQLMRVHPAYTGSPQDILHDAFLLLIRKIEADASAIRSPFLYWKGISRYVLLNAIKRDSKLILIRDDESAFNAPDSSPEDMVLDRETREELLGYFEQLGPKCKMLLLLWMERYSIPEITAKLGLSNDGVTRKLKYTCFKKLKKLWEDGNKMPSPKHNRVE